MCSISKSYKPDCGPIIQVLVFPLIRHYDSGELIPTVDPTLNYKEIPAVSPYDALIDTGANITCISDKVFKECLPSFAPRAMTEIRGVKGSEESNLASSVVPAYSVAIVFLVDSEPHVKFLNAIQTPMIGRMKRSDSVIADVIIGTDLISTCSLSLHLTNFTLTLPK